MAGESEATAAAADDDGKSPDKNLHWIRIRSGLLGTLGLSTSADWCLFKSSSVSLPAKEWRR